MYEGMKSVWSHMMSDVMHVADLWLTRGANSWSTPDVNTIHPSSKFNTTVGQAHCHGDHGHLHHERKGFLVAIPRLVALRRLAQSFLTQSRVCCLEEVEFGAR
jgi:hypothetical protein